MEVILAAIAALFVLSGIHREPAERRRATRRQAPLRRAPQRRLGYTGSTLGPSITLSQPRRASVRR